MGSPKLDTESAITAWMASQGFAYMLSPDTTFDDLWKLREECRYLTGQYKRLPDDIIREMGGAYEDMNEDHFLHVSTDDPGMVAYTPDAGMGKQDRQIRTRFGRYLKNASGLDLTEPEIAKLGAMLRNYMKPPELKIADTEEEIARVYADGPRSCMGGGGECFDSCLSPVRVYASPDVGVAYVERGKRIVARAVVRYDRMEWISIYGDETALEPALEAAGYSAGGDLDGCRLKIIESHGSQLMPYLDGYTTSIGYHTDNDGSWWIVGGGDYCATSTHGYLHDEDREYCECCEEYAESVVWIDRYSEAVCEGCLRYSESYALVYIGRQQEWLRTDDEDIVGTYRDDYYTYDALPYHDLVITDNGDIAHTDDVVRDEITEEYIYTDDATAYKDGNGDICYTASTQDLVWSADEQVYLLHDDAIQLECGAYVSADNDLIGADESQFKILGYVPLATALIEAKAHRVLSQRSAA